MDIKELTKSLLDGTSDHYIDSLDMSNPVFANADKESLKQTIKMRLNGQARQLLSDVENELMRILGIR